jgi:predicted nucleic acid-binding protein
LNPKEEVAEQAMRLARAEKLTFYDAIYPALSKFLSLPLITADKEQLTIAKEHTETVHLSAIGGLALPDPAARGP